MILSTFMDWQPHILNLNYVRVADSVTWPNRERLMYDEPLQTKDVIEIVERSQYTFQIVEDGGAIQLYYRFDRSGRQLIEASLAFYRLNILKGNSEDEEIFGPIVSASDIAFEQPVTWMRLDFSPEAARSVCHGATHIHFGGLKDLRLLVREVPNPHQFVEFVMSLFYPETYEKHRLETDWSYSSSTLTKINNFNRRGFGLEKDNMCKIITHVALPE